MSTYDLKPGCMACEFQRACGDRTLDESPDMIAYAMVVGIAETMIAKEAGGVIPLCEEHTHDLVSSLAFARKRGVLKLSPELARHAGSAKESRS